MRLLKFGLLTLSLSIFQFLNSQQTSTILNGNSASAFISDQGRLFHQGNLSSAGYELPVGSGNHLIYNGGFWFGGTNQNSELKLAAHLFGVGKDFNRGPYSSTNDYNDTAYIYSYESAIWNVKKSEIIYHIDNYNQLGYVAPDGILNWPGNGNASIGVAEQLAPYVDLNNNGIYEPHKGEYPCIKGDEMVYQIMNDDRIHNESGGEKIGAEIHIIVYQDQATNFVDSTTFIEVTIINKGQNSFSDFKVAFYIDPDVGFSDDDYIGSDPSKNLMYAYNSNNFDPGQGGSPGYGSFPPTLGVVSLTKDVDYSGTFHRYDGGVLYAMTDPSSPADYWNYMNGKWLDGSDWTLGGDGHGGASGSTHHLYNGNPSQGTGWTELDIDGNGTSNVSGDRRLLMTSIEESFQPGDTLTYNYGIIVNRNGDLMENIQGIINYADSVKTYFHNTTYSCIHQGTGTADVFEIEDITYPFNFEITRLDGEGNMSRAVKIDAQSEQNILDSISVKSIGYKRGHGPIEVRRTDTLNQTLGHFVLKFNDYATNIDTANWTIYHYDTIGGVLIDSVNSTSAINIGNEMLIPQWGMAVKVKQHNYFCKDNSPQCTFRDKIAKPLETTLTFEDDNNNWLTGVKNANGMAPMNWIMSGDFSGTSIPGDSIHNPVCYSANFYDYNNLFTNMADGIVSPSILARYGECDLTPIALSSSVGTYSLLMSNVVMDLPTVYQTSIDIVFTNDKSKWTRSPVIELNKDNLTSLNGGKAGFLRQSPSVDKHGNADGTGTGMGWFPGYAIDVESGRRLNIAFGENSTMTDDNGDDMLWNPSSRVLTQLGSDYVFGGEHYIYTYRNKQYDIDLAGLNPRQSLSFYDGGQRIFDMLRDFTTGPEIRRIHSNMAWIGFPMLASGFE